MTLTVKESPRTEQPEQAGLAFEESKKEKSSSGPRPNPVCLEVPVTIRSSPAQGDASGTPEPFREEGRTVIVFDNGAVLRLSKNLPAGQAVILSNAQGRDVACRVVNTRNLSHMKGYVEVEFVDSVSDFWRIHQTGAPANVSIAPPPVLVPAQLVPIQAPPPEPIRVAPLVTAPAKETNKSTGSAPTFEDIAGLVRMSPAAGIRDKATEPSPKPAAVKGTLKFPVLLSRLLHPGLTPGRLPHRGKVLSGSGG